MLTPQMASVNAKSWDPCSVGILKASFHGPQTLIQTGQSLFKTLGQVLKDDTTCCTRCYTCKLAKGVNLSKSQHLNLIESYRVKSVDCNSLTILTWDCHTLESWSTDRILIVNSRHVSSHVWKKMFDCLIGTIPTSKAVKHTKEQEPLQPPVHKHHRQQQQYQQISTVTIRNSCKTNGGSSSILRSSLISGAVMPILHFVLEGP